MTRNFCSLHGSKMRCNLGWSEHEQVGESGRQFAASSAAGRTIAVAWSGASRGGAPGWGDAQHGERLERDAQRRRAAVAETSVTRSSPGLDAAQRRALIARLKDGALAHGFATELWTLSRV